MRFGAEEAWMEVIHNGRAEVTQGEGQIINRTQEEEQTIQKALWEWKTECGASCPEEI